MAYTYDDPSLTYDSPVGYNGGAIHPLNLIVEFAPGVAASAVPTADRWRDISNRVQRIDIRTGRDDEFAQPAAGQMDLDLSNHDGALDPDNTAGIYYPNLKPLMWFRAYNRSGGVDTSLFYGQVSIEGWRLRASQFPDSTVSVTVLDMFEQLANTDLPPSVYEMEVDADNPRAWYRLGESSGTVATDSSGNGHHGTYEGGATFNSRAGLIAEDGDNAIEFDGRLDQYAVVPNAAGITSTTWTVEAWVKTAASFGGTIYGQYTWGSLMWIYVDPGDGKVTVSGAGGGARSTVAVNNDTPRHIAVSVSAGVVSVYVDGINRTTAATVVGTPANTTSTRTALGILPGDYATASDVEPMNGTLDEVAIYNSALSAARIAAHYAAGANPWKGDRSDVRITKLLDAINFPSTLRTIEAGVSTLQRSALNTAALSALQEVAKAERGELYVDHANGGKVRFRSRQARWTAAASITSQATFGDGGGAEIPVAGMDVQDDRIVNRATVQRANGSAVTANDSASETTYQRRSHSEAGLLFETDAETQGRADLIVAEKKDRKRRVRAITLTPTASGHPAWAQVFARRIGDRVTTKWRPPYGGTYSFDSWIEGVRHSWEPGAATPWRTVFSLSPVPYGGGTDTTYWIWDTSRWDTDTRWGY